MAPIKLNAVVERGVNDDDIIPLVEFSREHGFAMRFIEYMDVGNSNNWTSAKLVSKKEIIEKIHSRYPLREIGRDQGSAPSVDYEFVDGQGDIGVIASVTEPFCSSCTRLRLTADGKIVTCLFSQLGHDVKGLMRGGATDDGGSNLPELDLAKKDGSLLRRAPDGVKLRHLRSEKPSKDRNDLARRLIRAICASANLWVVGRAALDWHAPPESSVARRRNRGFRRRGCNRRQNFH